jgi:predicted dehydrogenase
MTAADTTPRRFAIVGTGNRAGLYVDALLGPFRRAGSIVAWCEPNPARSRYYDEVANAAGAAPVATYAPQELAAMIRTEAVDVVVVASPDSTHGDVVARALHAGADVILEKPMAMSVDGCLQIQAAAEATGREPVVTFNYRYSPRNSALKQVIASGAIGEVTAVHFEWLLDTGHGADYFRRWHRTKANSGGLLVHKATHHFDLVNWWLADRPDTIYAQGALRFYGPDGAGLGEAGLPRPERGTPGAPGGPSLRAPADPWAMDLRASEPLRRMYLDGEPFDGYRRDQDVFAPGVSIEDTMSVMVRYTRGVQLTYSLIAYSPWEGYRVSVTGTRGRAELDVVERAAHLPASEVVDPSAKRDTGGPRTHAARRDGERLVVQRHFEEAREVAIPSSEGAHGGGDALLLRDVLLGPGDDPLGRPAGWRDGIASAVVGLAANRSMATGGPVTVADLGLEP